MTEWVAWTERGSKIDGGEEHREQAVEDDDHEDGLHHRGGDVAAERLGRAFHRETFDASDIDIDIKGVNVSVNNKELLVDAHLRLKPGVRYGMVGQNGVGKSG